MLGPLSKSPFSIFRVNPIDVSAPQDSSIPRINQSLVPCYKSAGVGAWLGKAYITDVFKVMPLHPSQWNLFGVKWHSKFYFSVKLTFGCCSSPHIFDTLSEALCWILHNTCVLPFVLHLLDDFLVVDFPSSPPARSISTVKSLFHELGLPLSEEKTIGPSTRLEFLGITLDSILMRASLPQDKLSRIRVAIKSWSAAAILSKRDLLSLLGHLIFAMRFIPHARLYHACQYLLILFKI